VQSPRARGSFRADHGRVGSAAAVPAGAGVVPASANTPPPSACSPRGRGGRSASSFASGEPAGQSPRARGSFRHEPGREQHEGAVPAGAGVVPGRPSPGPRAPRSPRGRGGRSRSRTRRSWVRVQSPQARVSFPVHDVHRGRLQAVPAGAGVVPDHAHRADGVERIPRTRGGRSWAGVSDKHRTAFVSAGAGSFSEVELLGGIGVVGAAGVARAQPQFRGEHEPYRLSVVRRVGDEAFRSTGYPMPATCRGRRFPGSG
jgi:hypothetical protein